MNLDGRHSQPIRFSAPMVRAILEDRKTQTRRIVRPQPNEDGLSNDSDSYPGPWIDTSSRVYRCPYGDQGTLLWVKETWGAAGDDPEKGAIFYKQDSDVEGPRRPASVPRWRNARYMPRAVCRLYLAVCSVRVERLHDITEEDAKAEGVLPFFERFPTIGRDQRLSTGELAADAPYRASYAVAWDEINGARAPWIKNPWVWCVTFERIES